MKRKRFTGPIYWLSLERLGRSRKLQIASSAIALTILVLLSTVLEMTEEQKSTLRPLEMRMIVRQARLTEPFHLEKAETEKRTMMRKVTHAQPEPTSEPEIRRERLNGRMTSLRQEVDPASDLPVEEIEPQPERAGMCEQE